MKSLIPVVAVSILSATLVGITCKADAQEKQQEVKEKPREVGERAVQESNKETAGPARLSVAM
ncbi:MAG TPA: hypothetical protein VIF37_02060 [Methylobacter sp.]|jgi:hypothetical protein